MNEINLAMRDKILHRMQNGVPLTLDSAYSLVAHMSHNQDKRKHVGIILSFMCKSGTIRRIKNGVFALPLDHPRYLAPEYPVPAPYKAVGASHRSWVDSLGK
jgi:hypothetical protein